MSMIDRGGVSFSGKELKPYNIVVLRILRKPCEKIRTEQIVPYIHLMGRISFGYKFSRYINIISFHILSLKNHAVVVNNVQVLHDIFVSTVCLQILGSIHICIYVS
jgi:hypothetical protein